MTAELVDMLANKPDAQTRVGDLSVAPDTTFTLLPDRTRPATTVAVFPVAARAELAAAGLNYVAGMDGRLTVPVCTPDVPVSQRENPELAAQIFFGR